MKSKTFQSYGFLSPFIKRSLNFHLKPKPQEEMNQRHRVLYENQTTFCTHTHTHKNLPGAIYQVHLWPSKAFKKGPMLGAGKLRLNYQKEKGGEYARSFHYYQRNESNKFSTDKFPCKVLQHRSNNTWVLSKEPEGNQAGSFNPAALQPQANTQQSSLLLTLFPFIATGSKAEDFGVVALEAF